MKKLPLFWIALVCLFTPCKCKTPNGYKFPYCHRDSIYCCISESTIRNSIDSLSKADSTQFPIADSWHELGMCILISELADSLKNSLAVTCFERSERYKRLYAPDSFFQIARSLLMYGRCCNQLKSDSGMKLIDNSIQMMLPYRMQARPQIILSAGYIDSGSYFARKYSFYEAIRVSKMVLSYVRPGDTAFKQFEKSALEQIIRSFVELNQQDSTLFYLNDLQKKCSPLPKRDSTWLNHQKALIYYNKYLIIRDSISLNAAKQYLDSAKQYLDSAKLLCEQALIDYRQLKDSALMAKGLSNLALIICCQKKDDTTALKTVEQALLYANDNPKRHLSEIYRIKGAIYDSLNQSNKALEFYQKASSAATQQEDTLKAERAIAELYEKKGDLKWAIEHFYLADNSIQKIRDSLYCDKAKLFWNQEALPIYEGGLRCSWKLYQKKKNLTDWENALHFSERAHSPIFWEKLHHYRSQHSIQLKDVLRIYEGGLQWNWKLYQKKKSLTDWETVLHFSERAYSPNLWKKLHHDRAQDSIPQNSIQPKMNLKKLQKQLPNKQLVVEYFFNKQKNALYVLSWSRSKYDFTQVAIDTHQLNQFINSIASFKPQKPTIYFQGLGYALYQTLLAGILKMHHSDSIQRIRILPDEALSQLSFESLNDSTHYLLHDYTFSYGFKAVDTLYAKPRTISQDSIGAFGITNFVNTVQHQNLKSTELDSILPWKITTFKNENASIDNLEQYIKYYELIHFSTHAQASADKPELSALVLRSQTADEDLTVADLLEPNLKMDHLKLVVLGACQTGIGKFEAGEGTISIARAFRIKGCESVVMTFYSVEGFSTRDILKHFYEYLSPAKDLDEVLHDAKCAYLSTHPNEQHPYYWSGLGLTGNIAPIDIHPASNPF
ncbi:MAG: hypothetical protein RLZZ628_2100 [Bacteroidota bacterium]